MKDIKKESSLPNSLGHKAYITDQRGHSFQKSYKCYVWRANLIWRPPSFPSPSFMHSHTPWFLWHTHLLSYVHWTISSLSMMSHISFFHFLFESMKKLVSDLLPSATLGEHSISCLINYILIIIHGWFTDQISKWNGKLSSLRSVSPRASTEGSSGPHSLHLQEAS